MTETHTTDGVTETIQEEDWNPDSPHNRGYKLGYQAALSLRPPSFPKGLVVTCRSLVVDDHGQSWWVDPEKNTCVALLDPETKF